jgi:hypothetical protein
MASKREELRDVIEQVMATDNEQAKAYAKKFDAAYQTLYKHGSRLPSAECDKLNRIVTRHLDTFVDAARTLACRLNDERAKDRTVREAIAGLTEEKLAVMREESEKVFEQAIRCLEARVAMLEGETPPTLPESESRESLSEACDRAKANIEERFGDSAITVDHFTEVIESMREAGEHRMRQTGADGEEVRKAALLVSTLANKVAKETPVDLTEACDNIAKATRDLDLYS